MVVVCKMCFRAFGELHEVAGGKCAGQRYHERRADTVSVLKFIDRSDKEVWVEEGRLFETPKAREKKATVAPRQNRNYKTVLCRSFPDCEYGPRCLYAHGSGELRH